MKKRIVMFAILLISIFAGGGYNFITKIAGDTFTSQTDTIDADETSASDQSDKTFETGQLNTTTINDRENKMNNFNIEIGQLLSLVDNLSSETGGLNPVAIADLENRMNNLSSGTEMLGAKAEQLLSLADKLDNFSIDNIRSIMNILIPVIPIIIVIIVTISVFRFKTKLFKSILNKTRNSMNGRNNNNNKTGNIPEKDSDKFGEIGNDAYDNYKKNKKRY